MKIISSRQFDARRPRWFGLPACVLVGAIGVSARPSATTVVTPSGASTVKAASPPAPVVSAGTGTAPLSPVPERSAIKPGSRALPGSQLRDPFRGPEEVKPAAAPASHAEKPRPPGLRGLLVDRVRLQGIVREEMGSKMMAMVASQNNLSYFLHENDHFYDGVVSKITPDALYIRRTGSGPHPGSGEVVLRLGPGPGGQP